jgi:hypothetical protein
MKLFQCPYITRAADTHLYLPTRLVPVPISLPLQLAVVRPIPLIAPSLPRPPFIFRPIAPTSIPIGGPSSIIKAVTTPTVSTITGTVGVSTA